jgi:hypothetical protein
MVSNIKKSTRAFWKLFAILIAVGLLIASFVPDAFAQQGTWTEPVMLGPGWFPEITADQTGRVHLAWSSSITERDPTIPSLRGPSRRGYDVVLYRYTDDGINLSDTYDIAAFRQLEGSEVTRPSFLVDHNGIMHMTFRYNTVYYGQAPAEAATDATAWRGRIRLSVDQVAYFSWLVKDSEDRLHVVFTENVRTFDCPICYHIFYRYSDDNGATWSIRTDVSSLPTGSAKPQMILDSHENLHVVWEAGRGGALGQLTEPTTVMYAASYNRGQTWTRPFEFVVPDGRAKNITIEEDGSGNLIVAWLALPENNVYFQVSSDQGRNWSEPEIIEGIRGSWAVYNSRLDHYTMTTDSAGNIHLVLVGKATTDRGTLDLVHLTWNGRSWGEPDIITTMLGDAPEWPRAVVNNGNELHVVWFVRDEDHIFDSDRGEYSVWYANRILRSPGIEPQPFPTPTPTPVIIPTPTPVIPTPTPVDPVVYLTPVSPELTSYIYGEIDDLVLMGQALIPAAVIILLVVAVVQMRRR